MADITAHVDEVGHVEVEIHDAQGNITTDWDVVGGVRWRSTNEAAVFVSDTDANPQDAEIAFRGLTAPGEEVFLECEFDGRVGPDVNLITLRSQSLAVDPGPATGGVIHVFMKPA